jgi:hypothetical protein
MALGTVTRYKGFDTTWGNKRVRVVDVQLTSGANYTAGGETITAQQVGLKFIESANVLSLALPSGAATSRSVGVVYNNSDRTSVKLSVQTTASAEAAASSNQSTFTVRIQFIGTGGAI